mgnify:CR=1 FL=1|jgi:hypothetical protein
MSKVFAKTKKERAIVQIIKTLNSAYTNESCMSKQVESGLLKLDFKTLDALRWLVLTSNVKEGK